MTLILYLHGFASVGNSDKSRALAAALPQHQVISPDLPLNPRRVISLVEEILDAHDHARRREEGKATIFTGTSLGGFWSSYFAQKHQGIAVIANPSTTPSQTLARHLGQQVQNYTNGKDIEVTATDLKQFRVLEDEIRSRGHSYPCHLFLAQDDELLDYRLADAFYQQATTKTILPDGGHRFTQHWPRVVERVKTLV